MIIFTIILLIRAIEKATRVVFCKGAVEPGIRNSRVVTNHTLDSLFEGKHIKLKYKPKNKDLDEGSSSDEDIELDDEGCQDVVRPVVVCNDPKEFIAKVMLERIKIGADDGQGLFNLIVQLLSHVVFLKLLFVPVLTGQSPL